MSQAFKCDRCKKMIEGSSTTTAYYRFLVSVTKKTVLDIGRADYELCSYCWNDAVLFMENKPTEKR